MGSPSSRRAWIEIHDMRSMSTYPDVALLAEGVDRNYTTTKAGVLNGWSPSSRRAWIEINYQVALQPPKDVALLAEGVDRNNEIYA